MLIISMPEERQEEFTCPVCGLKDCDTYLANDDEEAGAHEECIKLYHDLCQRPPPLGGGLKGNRSPLLNGDASVD